MPVVSPSDSGVVAVSLVIIGLSYFVPTLIAYSRRHRKRGAILALNLLTGWTAIGWAIAAVWSSTPNVESRRAKATYAMEKYAERRKLAS